MSHNQPVSTFSTWQEATAWRDALDAAGKRIVFTNGVFDLLHVGHARYLAEARALGDALVIAINADASVRELKGEGRPLNSAEDRAELLLALGCVDRVVIFEGKRCTEVIDAIRPHLYAKGGDYTVETLNGEERGALERANSEIHILSLVPGKSTSSTLAKMSEKTKPQLAVLGSGQGSNFEAIHAATQNGTLDAEIAIVISDVETAPILDKACAAGIPAIYIAPANEGKRGHLGDAAIKEIIDRLKAAQVDLVALAGFMRIVREPLLSEFPERIINTHPSLLPKFPGLHAAKQAIEAGETVAGCTIHLVDSGIDTGKTLAQAEVPIEPEDTPESLNAKIQAKEHCLFPEVLGELLARMPR